MYGMYGGLYGFSKPKKAKKPKKVPKDSWFERLTNDELKSLCKSAKLRLSGTKPELVARLQENEGTARFGVESKPARLLLHGDFTDEITASLWMGSSRSARTRASAPPAPSSNSSSDLCSTPTGPARPSEPRT